MVAQELGLLPHLGQPWLLGTFLGDEPEDGRSHPMCLCFAL